MCVLAGDVLMLRLRWSVAAAAVIVRRYYSVVMIAIWRSRAVSSAVHYYGDVENDLANILSKLNYITAFRTNAEI